MIVLTGISNTTIWFAPDGGWHVVEPMDTCHECGAFSWHPLAWMCGSCGEVI